MRGAVVRRKEMVQPECLRLRELEGALVDARRPKVRSCNGDLGCADLIRHQHVVECTCNMRAYRCACLFCAELGPERLRRRAGIDAQARKFRVGIDGRLFSSRGMLFVLEFVALVVVTAGCGRTCACWPLKRLLE